MGSNSGAVKGVVNNKNTPVVAGAFREKHLTWNYSFKELGSEVFLGDFWLR